MKRTSANVTCLLVGALLSACVGELPVDPTIPGPRPLPIPTPVPTPTPTPTPTPDPSAVTGSPLPSASPLATKSAAIGTAGGQFGIAGLATLTFESGSFAGGTTVTLSQRSESDKPWGDFAQVGRQFDIAGGASPTKAATVTIGYDPNLMNGVDPSYIRLVQLEAHTGALAAGGTTTYRAWAPTAEAPVVDSLHKTVTFSIERFGSFTLVAPAKPVGVSAASYWTNPSSHLDVGSLATTAKTKTGYEQVGFRMTVNNVELPGATTGQNAESKAEGYVIVEGPIAQSGSNNRGDVIKAWHFDKLQDWTGTVTLSAAANPDASRQWRWNETITLTFKTTSDGSFEGTTSSAFSNAFTAPCASNASAQATAAKSGTAAYKVKGTLKDGKLTFEFIDQPDVAAYTASCSGDSIDDELASVYVNRSGKGVFEGTVTNKQVSFTDNRSLTATPWLPASTSRSVSLQRSN